METHQHTSRERQRTEITGSDKELRGEKGGKGRGKEVIREREQVSSPVHREDGVKDLVKEIAALNYQLSSVQLEADHQRVKLQSQLAEAEAEASARAASEEATEMVRIPVPRVSTLERFHMLQVSSLRREHTAQVDSLKAEFARHHSQSEVAALHSQLSAMEVECHLMRERLEAAEGERDRLRGVREREEVLSQQVKQLSRQLVEAKRHHTPVRGLLAISLLSLTHMHTPIFSLLQEMHHFSSLQAKITLLESRLCLFYIDPQFSSVTPSVSPLPPPSAPPSLSPFLPPSLPPTLLPSLPPSLLPSLPPSFPPSLPPSLPPFLPPSLLQDL